MGRGFLSGLFWGGIIGIVALFVSNQALDRQTLSFPKPNATEVEVPGGSEFNQARPETDPVVPGTDTRPAGDVATGVAVPSDDVADPPVMDTTALEVPVPETTQEALDSLGTSPEAVSDVDEPQVSEDASVDTGSASGLATPEAPATAPDTAVVEAPAGDQSGTDAAPEISAEADQQVGADTEIAALPGADDTPLQPESDTAPQVSGQTEAPSGLAAPNSDDEQALPWLESLREAQIDEAPDAPELPSVSEEPSLPPVGADDAVNAAPEVDVASDAAPVAPDVSDVGQTDEENVAPQVEMSQDQTGSGDLQPVGTLTERDESAVSGGGSLPVVRRFGDSATLTDDVAPQEEVVEEDAAPEVEEMETGGPALQAFASEFDASTGLPLLSIVLVHVGDAPLNETILEVLPPHVGFGVDVSQPNAGQIAAAYRAAGREVVMIPSLPEGATPQDIEQALAVNFDQVPEAVAVMDVSGASFQSDRTAVEQVVEVVSGSGHGLITFPRGLNTAHQVAQRAGVPTGLIFRNLDGGSEDQEQISRSLDRAAFRARQDEAVILVGTTGSTMLSALTEWVRGNRATTVTIAPISAALGG